MDEDFYINDSRKKAILVGSAIAAVFIFIVVGVFLTLSGNSEEKNEKNSESSKRSVSKSTSSTTTSTTSTTNVDDEEPSSTTSTKVNDSSGKKFIMPYVECENLQAAQSMIRATGSMDITFQNGEDPSRIPQVNTEWVVVSQYPEAGSSFEEGEAVLYAMRYDETDNCE